MGPLFSLVALLGAFAVTGLLVKGELSGVTSALQQATSIHYLLWVPVAAALVLLVVWLLPFELMEKIYGLLGLTMLVFVVFVVAVWHLAPDRSRMWSSATTPQPVAGKSWAVYLFFLVTLIGAQMTPYEMFFSSGAVESRWRPKDLTEMRVNVLVGFPLGGFAGHRHPGGRVPGLPRRRYPGRARSQTVSPVAVALGKNGLVVALVSVFAATFGAHVGDPLLDRLPAVRSTSAGPTGRCSHQRGRPGSPSPSPSC